MKMMKPKRCPKQALFILIMTALLVLLSGYSAVNTPYLAVYFRIIGGASLAVGAVLMWRYTLTTYVYVMEGNVFSVRRSAGFAERTVFSKELKKEDKLLLKKEAKKVKCRKSKSFRQNLSANCAYLVFEDASLSVEFEPNEQFYLIIQAALNDLKE